MSSSLDVPSSFSVPSSAPSLASSDAPATSMVPPSSSAGASSLEASSSEASSAMPSSTSMLPTSPSFVIPDVVDAPFLVQLPSDVVPVGVFSGIAFVTVGGPGSPQVRACATPTCSANEPWSVAAQLTSGQYVQVRVTTDPLGLTTRTVTITAGTFSTMWSVTTRPPEVRPLPFMSVERDDDTYVFPNVPLGPAASNRHLVVVAHYTTNISSRFDWVEVEGMRAQRLISVAEDQGTSAPIGIFIIEQTMSTVGTVEFEITRPAVRAGVAVYAVYGLRAETVVSTDTRVGEGPGQLTLATQEGSVVIAGLSQGAPDNEEITWSGVLETYDMIVERTGGVPTLNSGGFADRIGSTTVDVRYTADNNTYNVRAVGVSLR